MKMVETFEQKDITKTQREGAEDTEQHLYEKRRRLVFQGH